MILHSFIHLRVYVRVRACIYTQSNTSHHLSVIHLALAWCVVCIQWICSTTTHPHCHAPFLHSVAYCIAFCLLARIQNVREWRFLALLTVKAHTPHPSNCCWIIVCVYASSSEQMCVCMCVYVVFQQFSTAIKTATASPRDHKNRMSAMKNDKNIGREREESAVVAGSKPLEHVYVCMWMCAIYGNMYIFTFGLNNSCSGVSEV